jgi:hypothetical protein
MFTSIFGSGSGKSYGSLRIRIRIHNTDDGSGNRKSIVCLLWMVKKFFYSAQEGNLKSFVAFFVSAFAFTEPCLIVY